MTKQTLTNQLPFGFETWVELYAVAREAIHTAIANKEKSIQYNCQDGDGSNEHDYDLVYVLDISVINQNCMLELDSFILTSFDCHILNIALIKLEYRDPGLASKLSMDKLYKIVKLISPIKKTHV